MIEHGKRVWYFPDGDLPCAGEGELKGHESLVILNPNSQVASLKLTVYFTARDPVTLNAGQVPAERVICIRTNEPVDGFQIPLGQYALKVEGSVGIIAQLGRMDVSQPNLAYYTTMGYGM